MTRSSIAFWLVGSLAGCVSYATEAEIEAISRDIAGINGPSREAAVKEALASHGAHQIEVAEENVAVAPEVEGCRAVRTSAESSAAEKLTIAGRSTSYVVDCAGFANLVWGRTPVVARTADGKQVLLVASRTHDNDACVIGAREGGRALVVEPRLEVSERREIRKRGECNRMPSPEPPPRTITFFAVEATAAEVVGATYRGQATEYVCDSYVE